MATVLLLSPDPRARARLHGGLSGAHRLVDVANWAEVPGALRMRPADLFVFAPLDSEGDIAPRLTWLQRQRPEIAVLVYTVLRGGGREAWRLGRLGVDGLVVEGSSDGRADLRQAARRAIARALGRTVGRALRGRVDPLLLRCLVRAIDGATRPMTPSDLAEPEGLDVASLGRRLRSGGLAPPGRIIRWGVTFRAVAALDRGEHTVEAIALALGYSTGTALGRALRRDVGYPPSTLRVRGGIGCAIEAFLDREAGAGSGPGLVLR